MSNELKTLQTANSKSVALLVPVPTSQPKEVREGSAGVIAVVRALPFFKAFVLDESHLSLSELSRRCTLHESTTLPLARPLAQAGYMLQREDGDWRPGPRAGWSSLPSWF